MFQHSSEYVFVHNCLSIMFSGKTSAHTSNHLFLVLVKIRQFIRPYCEHTLSMASFIQRLHKFFLN